MLYLFADSNLKIEETARVKLNVEPMQTYLSCLFHEKESGFVLRPSKPWDFTGHTKLNFYVNNTNPHELRINIKFWGQKNTYQTWYVSVPIGLSTVQIDLGGVRDYVGIDKVLLMKIYSDEVHPLPILFLDGFFTTTKPEVQAHTDECGSCTTCAPMTSLPDGMIVNGDFKYGLVGWGFWSGNGKYKQVAKDLECRTYGGIEFQAFDPSTTKTDAWVFSDTFTLDPGEYVFSLRTKVDKKTSWRWFFATVDSQDKSVLTGEYYLDTKTLEPSQDKEHVYTFKVNSRVKVQLYIVNSSPTSLYFTGVRLWKRGEGKRAFTIDNRLLVDGRDTFVLGFYGQEPTWLSDVGFTDVKPRRWPDKDYLDLCVQKNLCVWLDLSGAARTKFFKSLNKLETLTRNHPGYIGIYTCDEPDHDVTRVTPPEMRLMNMIVSNKGPTWLTVMSWNESAVYEYRDACDILGAEIYPVINRKGLDWCANVMDRLMRCSVGKPCFAVPEASPELSIEQQRCLLWMGLAAGTNGVFVWDEGIEKDPVKFQAFSKTIKEIKQHTKGLRLVDRFYSGDIIGCVKTDGVFNYMYILNYTPQEVSTGMAIPYEKYFSTSYVESLGSVLNYSILDLPKRTLAPYAIRILKGLAKK